MPSRVGGGGVQVQYKPGDVVFLQAAVLEYFKNLIRIFPPCSGRGH